MKVRRTHFVFAIVVAILHAVVLGSVRAAVGTSDVLLDLCALLACLACYARSRMFVGAARRKWCLVAAGLFVWCVGQSLATYSEGLLHLPQAPTAINSDFKFSAS